MKKWFLAISLAFIVLGLTIVASGYYPISKEDQTILASTHNVPIQNTTDGVYYVIEGTTIGTFIPQNATYNATLADVRVNPEQWKVSANLTKGDMLDIWITQGLDWPDGMFDVDELLPGNIGALHVMVNVTDPRGNFTLFDITLGRNTDQTFRALTVFFINITDPSYNQGGLDVSPFYVNTPEHHYYMKVGGIAQFNGTYTVRVIPPWPGRKYPVTSIQMLKHFSRTEYTTTYTLPAGITVSSAGIVLSFISVRRKPKVTHAKKPYPNMKKP